jgi:hypothetical protein
MQGLLQHHDAVTGTARRHVVVDYRNRLQSCITKAEEAMRAALTVTRIQRRQSKR